MDRWGGPNYYLIYPSATPAAPCRGFALLFFKPRQGLQSPGSLLGKRAFSGVSCSRFNVIGSTSRCSIDPTPPLLCPARRLCLSVCLSDWPPVLCLSARMHGGGSARVDANRGSAKQQQQNAHTRGNIRMRSFCVFVSPGRGLRTFQGGDEGSQQSLQIPPSAAPRRIGPYLLVFAGLLAGDPAAPSSSVLRRARGGG